MTDETVATFDVDESTAALVLQHVDDLRDRMALASTSRVWRDAATAPATCRDRLVVEGAVAARLTDDRLEILLNSYAGPGLRSLEVRDALVMFTGTGLVFGPLVLDDQHQPEAYKNADAQYAHYENRFPELQTLILNQCPGVEPQYMNAFLEQLEIDNRDKKDRLDRLGLAGCCNDLSQAGLAILDTFVRHERDVSLPFAAGPFDLWPCVHCPLMIDEGIQCVDCKSVACMGHGEGGIGDGAPICSFCDAYVCLSADCGADDGDGDTDGVAHSAHCGSCGVAVCFECARGTDAALLCSGSVDFPGCHRVTCTGCIGGTFVCDRCEVRHGGPLCDCE
jgi:hypothetical protein